jgi:hypothetical protein
VQLCTSLESATVVRQWNCTISLVKVFVLKLTARFLWNINIPTWKQWSPCWSACVLRLGVPDRSYTSQPRTLIPISHYQHYTCHRCSHIHYPWFKLQEPPLFNYFHFTWCHYLSVLSCLVQGVSLVSVLSMVAVAGTLSCMKPPHGRSLQLNSPFISAYLM